MTDALAWLWTNEVPLWAFLAALLTVPRAWSRWLAEIARRRFGLPPEPGAEQQGHRSRDEAAAGEDGGGPTQRSR